MSTPSTADGRFAAWLDPDVPVGFVRRTGPRGEETYVGPDGQPCTEWEMRDLYEARKQVFEARRARAREDLARRQLLAVDLFHAGYTSRQIAQRTGFNGHELAEALRGQARTTVVVRHPHPRSATARRLRRTATHRRARTY